MQSSNPFSGLHLICDPASTQPKKKEVGNMQMPHTLRQKSKSKIQEVCTQSVILRLLIFADYQRKRGMFFFFFFEMTL